MFVLAETCVLNPPAVFAVPYLSIVNTSPEIAVTLYSEPSASQKLIISPTLNPSSETTEIAV